MYQKMTHTLEDLKKLAAMELRDKSKKNNNDRTQYRQKNHHEAIVSREVFNAANHLRASRNYSKKNRPLPVLSVVEDGILRGYVPFDKDWTGFSAEEYREASESVMKEPDAAVTADVKKRLDLTGYEVVRAQYFSTMQNPAMTISNGRLRFNTACLKKFENVEYVELLLNSVDRCIAIRPCDKNNPNAIRWGRLKEGRWCASTLGCRGLAKALFDIMEWDEDLRYRFRGQFLEQGDNKMMLFAFDEPEMIKVEEIVLPPKESTEEDEGETVKKKIYIFPPEWAGTFGQPITSIAQVGILRQEHYAGNWDVFRPASEIEEMNTFTAESLNKLLHEAEKIMEGWTDIDEWRLAEGKELGDKIMSMVGTLPLAFANPLPSLHPLDLLIGFFCGAGLRLAVYLRSKNAKKYRHGMEYGSARWGTPKDIEPFQAPKFADNIILTKTERLMMSNRPPDPKNARNKNVLVVGGSGSGKTRFWLKPNLLQCHSSYVVTDPKGSIVVECGNALLKNGYKVRILNTINFKKSMHYNPFAYVHSEKDILKLVTTLMTNTKGEGSGGDPFWEKSERLLLTALIAYLHYEAPVKEQNFATLLEMLNTMQVLEDDEEYQNPVDLLFEELGKKKPNSFAVRQYKLYKLAAGKTAKSILISCGARLAPFDIQELRNLTMYDELALDTLGDKKTALFLIMSDTDSTFNFLISMVYTQLFNLLCDKADDVYGGKLPIHVRCLIDECANIGQIPQLEKLVATIRSREISACLVLQTRSQLKAIYKDNADTIVGNMDSQIFLGGSEPTTLKDLAEALGKETIDSYNNSDTRGNSPSYGTNYQKLGHELMSRDELAVLDGGKCILQLRGVRPFLSDKYDLTQHPNYKLTSDYDPKNTFDIEKYLNRKEKIHPGDEFIVVDADSLPSA